MRRNAAWCREAQPGVANGALPNADGRADYHRGTASHNGEDAEMKLFDLGGRVAAVTGGNGGIGLGMAGGLAQADAKNARAVERLRALGARAEAAVIDVADDGCGDRLVEAALRHFGRLDILVNNAGINQRKLPQDYSADEWRRIIDVNLTSAFLCSKAAHGAMKRDGGKIINIGSMTSLFGAPMATAYGASKGGIVQLTKALAAAWAADRIQVNAVLPGWIDTDLTRAGRQAAPQMYEAIMVRTPARRWGVPEDLAGIAVFLASAASDFVTGTAIPVDGGYSAQA